MAKDCCQQLPPTSCVEGLLDLVLDLTLDLLLELVFINHRFRSKSTRLTNLLRSKLTRLPDLFKFPS